MNQTPTAFGLQSKQIRNSALLTYDFLPDALPSEAIAEDASNVLTLP